MADSNEKTYLSWYERTIEGLDADVNPVGIEAFMRLRYGTLDHLSLDDFKAEIAEARKAEAEEPGYLRLCADSYDRLKRFERWEQERK